MSWVKHDRMVAAPSKPDARRAAAGREAAWARSRGDRAAAGRRPRGRDRAVMGRPQAARTRAWEDRSAVASTCSGQAKRAPRHAWIGLDVSANTLKMPLTANDRVVKAAVPDFVGGR